MSNKLTAKQQKFVDEYIKDRNATQAAIRAGYSEKTARTIAAQNLTKVNIAEAIAKRINKVSEKDQIDALKVKQMAYSLFQQCIGEKPVKKVVMQDGVPQSVEVFEFNQAGANKALETLGKHVDIQAFKEKVETDVNLKGNAPVLNVVLNGGSQSKPTSTTD